MIDKLFAPNVRVIAEPGRFYVSSAFTLSLHITSRRTVWAECVDGEAKVPQYMYYVNDGMYGSFNCLTFDHATVTAQVLLKNGKFVFGKEQSDNASSSEGDSVYSSDDDACMSSSDNTFKCSIWGPTCDSIDCIGKDLMLPQLDVGDWLVYQDMGAYTMCAASAFNGFRKSAIIYTNTEF